LVPGIVGLFSGCLPKSAPTPFHAMSLTRRFIDQRIQKSRVNDAKTADLRRMLTTHNIIAGHGRSEKNVEGLRRCRSEAAERRDLFMDYNFVKGEQDRERRTLVSQAEESLAVEIARRNAENLRKEMDRRRICDGSEELRALKERLHAAKVNKERAQQLWQIEVRNEKNRRLEHAVAEHMNDERLEHIELEHKLEIEKMKQRERVKVINQQQIAMKEAQREEAMQEYSKERSAVEELVARIGREDKEEETAKAQKQEESKQMLIKFKIEQAERQEAAERAEFEENEAIAKYAKDKADREQRVAEEKAVLEKEKERLQLQIVAAAESKNKEKEELEQLRNELHGEEHEAEARRREQLQQRKKLEDREEMKAACEVQAQMSEKKKAAALEEEERIRAVLLSKFAEDDRIEQMAEHKRRMKVEAHKREAERLVQLRRESFDQQRDAEREEEQLLRNDEGDRQVIIEEERKKLLIEHAIPLRHFLPKGTLATQDDHEFVFSLGERGSYATGGQSGYPSS